MAVAAGIFLSVFHSRTLWPWQHTDMCASGQVALNECKAWPWGSSCHVAVQRAGTFKRHPAVITQELPWANGKQRWTNISGFTIHCCRISNCRSSCRSTRLLVGTPQAVMSVYYESSVNHTERQEITNGLHMDFIAGKHSCIRFIADLSKPVVHSCRLLAPASILISDLF